MVQWYYKVAEQVVGPLSADQLKALATGGRLAPNDPVAQSPAGPWVAASRVKGLFAVAGIDDQPQSATPPPLPAREQPAAISPLAGDSAARRIAEPPIPQPPVVRPGPSRAMPAVNLTPSSGDSAVSVAAPLSGFAIQTEQVGVASRFQKKAKKPREPLTKAQKNARLVTWLAAALVLGGAVFAGIPYLRALARPKAQSATAHEPVLRDLDVIPSTAGLDDALRMPSGEANRDSQATTPAAQGAVPSTSGSTPGRPESPSAEEAMVEEADAVQVRPVRVALDRPRMTNASGKVARPVNRLLVVELELRMKGSAAAARFLGFSSYGKQIQMTDERGAVYEVRTPDNFHGMFVEGQCREPVFLSSEEPTRDAVIFAWPEETAPSLPSSSDQVLRLRLPKIAFGEQGELRFEIPLSEIEVTTDGQEAATRANEADKAPPPERKKETSPPAGEPVDDGGPIPIPGLK